MKIMQKVMLLALQYYEELKVASIYSLFFNSTHTNSVFVHHSYGKLYLNIKIITLEIRMQQHR